MHCAAPVAVGCANCGTELPLTARFCPHCAHPAAANAPSANRPQPNLQQVAEYTPKHLAEKILTSRAAIEGERKQVTVMFADVKGSMDLAGQLDAEAWHDLLDRFFAILAEGVHRFEGTVNQYTGDGIMALFGAPIAHEDHAQRACYAALHVRDQLRAYADQLRIEQGVNFGVRIGLNSGDVVVGKIGDDLRMDYTAQGHTVGLAQRIEQLCESGRIYISAHTEHLVAGYFKLRNLGASQLKGADEPVGIFEVEEAGASFTRLDIARARGLTRFVGRTDEIRTLQSALQRAREGHGQVVGMVGEPGVGKSRLCYEFVERCRSEGITVNEAHCPAHGRNIPFMPILELYRSYFGIATQDSPAQARQKIADTLALLDPTLQEALPVLLDFMGVADPAQPATQLAADERQRRLFALLRQIYRIQADRGIAAVVLVDDVQWIDPASDTFVAQMVEATAENSRNLLLLNFRPEYEAGWMRRAHYQQLPLVPLGIDAIRELVENQIGRDPTLGNPGERGERIMRWTEGNPFFAEEIIHNLVETGHFDGTPGAYKLITDVDVLEVPDNVRAVLAARVDHLPESAKQLLQAASVIGKMFTGSIVEAVAELSSQDRALAIERLKESDFIFETALYPEVEFAFKHPLTQEVAYASLLQARRTKLHAATARVIESRAGTKLDEQAVLLAYHWDAASEPGRAIEWHERAGEWTIMSDPQASLRHWQRVRELVTELPADPETLSLGARTCARILDIGWQLGVSEEETTRGFKDGKALAERAGDVTLLAKLTGAFASLRGIDLGFAEDYTAYAREAVRLAEQTGDAVLQSAMRMRLVHGYFLSGQHAQVCDLSANALSQMPSE